MAQTRTLTVDFTGGSTDVVYVVGTQLTINLHRTAPPRASSFSVVSSENVNTNVLCVGWPWWEACKVPLDKDSVLLLTMSSASKEQGDGKVTIRMFDSASRELASAELLLTAVEISLDVDADRDGVVEKNSPNKASWKWGPGGHGAILLVNCDADSGKRPDNEENYVGSEEDLKDMSQMVLRTAGPPLLPNGYKLLLHMSATDAEGVRVFSRIREGYCLVTLDSLYGRLTTEVGFTKETVYYVEGIKFADKDFDGVVRIHVSLIEPGTLEDNETPIFTDTVQFKIAPWIMTPNLQAPLKVYVCSTYDNANFLNGMKKLVQEVGCELHVISEMSNRGDRWIQDEMEFGYIQAPHKSLPVVLDSPRDRGLDNFPYNELLGPDFGYVTMKPPGKEVNSLESFGNLEVSPPVTVNGKLYPLGRIIIGGAFPFQTDGRNMSSMIQHFFHAQVVQKPIVLFVDWLIIGHVDEFMSIVPAPDKKGFRLLLASPHAAYKLLKGLQETGHGQAKFFEDIPTMDKVTVDKILADKTLHDENDYYQRCIDWNRDVLKKELGLDEEDIVDLPLLYQSAAFKTFKEGRGAVAYYPDVVNMIVLGKNLGIAKPFGPKVNGKCAIETEVSNLLGPLGFNCHYIDDFTSYHLNLGDVHCGSNVRRKAFDFKWWDMVM